MRSFDTFLIVFSMSAGIGGAVVLLVQFLSLRVRNSALPAEERDPHLGRKFALGVFLHLSVMLLLAGLTVSFSETFDGLFGGNKNQWGGTPMTRPAMGPGGPGGPGWPPPPPPPTTKSWFDEWYTSGQRVAAGLVLSGVMHCLLFAMLLFFATNARKFPAVSRAFVLNRLLVAGIILMAVTTLFSVLMFSEGDLQMDSFGRPIGIAVVWGPAALAHFLWLMFGLSKSKGTQRVEEERPREADRGREGEGRSRREDDDRPPPRRRYD